MIKVDTGKCLRCGACVRDCVVEVLKPDENKIPFLAPELEKHCLNCQHCLAVCPAGALTCHGVSTEPCAPIGELPSPELMKNLVRQRRSIRQYKQKNLDPETLTQLKQILAWSPTGCNVHNLVFRMVDDKDEMEFFRSEMSKSLKFFIRTGLMGLVYPGFKRYMKEVLNGKDVIFRNAPHMIAAFVPNDAPCAEADPWIALSYFDLYAQSLGVGTCWSGFAVHAFKWNRRLKKKLGLPKGYRIGGILLFGKPDVSYSRAAAPENYLVYSSL